MIIFDNCALESALHVHYITYLFLLLIIYFTANQSTTSGAASREYKVLSMYCVYLVYVTEAIHFLLIYEWLRALGDSMLLGII